MPTKRDLLCASRGTAGALALIFLLAGVPGVARAQQGSQGSQAQPQPQSAQRDLTQRSLEDLMNIEVSSVSRSEQKLSRTAAAVFVIRQEDIQRSGATNIPDLLRMVPGLDVARANANTWLITARGFNERFGNEMLVLIDGRSVYSETIGGVFWDALDVPLEDIERIEVIRGPGASVWGINAVHGVVNIITKRASDTRGGLVVASGGSVEQAGTTVQYGGDAGKSTQYRIFAKFSNQARFPAIGGGDGGDGWHVLRGGFRTDSKLSDKDSLSFQGDLYMGREGNPGEFLLAPTFPGQFQINSLVNLGGGFLQGEWNHRSSSRSSFTVRASYQNYERSDILDEARSMYDLDFQHNLQLGERHNVVWGFGFRDSDSDTVGSFAVSLHPPGADTQLVSGFFQDEIAVVPESLYLTLGTKLEHDYYSHWSAMPTVRLAWMPAPRQTLWTAVSRAVRTPTDIDALLRTNTATFPGPGGVPLLISSFGNPLIQAESEVVFEGGYRTEVAERVSVDLAGFCSLYANQETSELGTPFFEASPAPAHFVQPVSAGNLMHGTGCGFEAGATWKVARVWELSPGYAFQQIHMHLDPSSRDTTSVAAAQGSTPVQSAQIRSHVSLRRWLAWDTSAYFTGRLTDPNVPSYTRLDSTFSARWGEHTTFSITGQDLLREEHVEFLVNAILNSAEIKRRVYAKVTWTF